MNQHVAIRVTRQQIGLIIDRLKHTLGGDDEQLRQDMLEGETDLHEIVSRLLAENEDDEGLVEALDRQIDARAERVARFKHRIEARKTAIASLMDCGQITKLALPEATLSLRSLAPRPKVASPDELPDAFIIEEVKLKANMDAIKEAVERGETIPGVVMTNGGTSLTVRRK